jgi:hypothetical protein
VNPPHPYAEVTLRVEHFSGGDTYIKVVCSFPHRGIPGTGRGNVRGMNNTTPTKYRALLSIDVAILLDVGTENMKKLVQAGVFTPTWTSTNGHHIWTFGDLAAQARRAGRPLLHLDHLDSHTSKGTR